MLFATRLDTRASRELDDMQLARAAAAGEDGAGARRVLAERLLDRVRTTVYYLAGPDRDRDDLVQSAMLAILRAVGSFRGEAKLETWADRITVRVARKQLAQRSQRESQVARAHDVTALSASRASEPDAAERRNVLRAELARALQRIPDKRRSVVVLACVYQYKLAEIAELTETPLNTVRERLRVGRQELRQLISKSRALAEWAEEL